MGRTAPVRYREKIAFTAPDAAGCTLEMIVRRFAGTSVTQPTTCAANVNLSIQTMHNWDLKNPNAAEGQRHTIF